MKKRILLALTVFALLTGVSAQSLQNFEYSPEDDYSVDLTGGESFTQNINFTSEADRELPFGVRVTVENDTTNFETSEENLGAEFDLTGSLTDSRAERDLSFKERLTDGNLVYVGSIDAENDSIGAFSENSLEVSVETDPAISPDSFNFRFDVRSAPGFASETNSSDVGNDNKAEVKVGESSVSVNTKTGKNVTVESYSETTVSSPEPDREFVGGVGVEVQDRTGGDAEANGTVSIGYSQQVVDDRDLDEDSMEVYYYNESMSQWTTEGVEVVNRDTGDNVVEANVSHFSTYAAFAEQQEEEDTDTSSTSGGRTIPYDPQPEEQEEPVNDTQQDDSGDETDDQQQETSPEEDTDNQESSGEDESTGTGESDQVTGQQDGAPQTPVGQFFTSETGIAGGLIVLLVALVVFLEYTGRIELRELKEVLRQKFSR